MIKKPKRLCLDSGLKVDTKTSGSVNAPTIPRIDSRYDWFENKNGVGSVRVRFSVTDFGSSEFRLFGTSLTDGAAILINKAANTIRYKNTNGTLTTQTIFNATLQTNVAYELEFIKIGEVFRAYLSTAPLSVSSTTASGLDRVTTNGFTFGSTTTAAIFIVFDCDLFNAEIDKKTGADYLNDIESMNGLGNYIPERLHPYVVGNWTAQETSGSKLYDSVEQFNYAKGTSLTPNHADLIGYTDTELGIPTKTTQTSRVNFYDKTTTNFWDGSGNELKTGLPELKNALLMKTSASSISANFASNYTVGDNWGFVMTLKPNPSASPIWQFLVYMGSGCYIEVAYNYVRLYGAGGVIIDTVTFDSNIIHTIFIQRTGVKVFEFCIDGIAFSTIDYSGNTGIADVHIAQFANTVVSAEDWYCMRWGFYKGNKTKREMLNLHNNSLLNNPIDLKSFAPYYNCGNVVSGAVPDLTGKNPDWALNYTANQLNPAHADYAIKTINSLR